MRFLLEDVLAQVLDHLALCDLAVSWWDCAGECVAAGGGGTKGSRKVVVAVHRHREARARESDTWGPWENRGLG
jgi:hypothetical protein